MSLNKETKPMFYWYRNRVWELRQFFTFQDVIIGLSQQLCWIDQINGNSFSSIPIGHSIQMKETHYSMDHLLSAINI